MNRRDELKQLAKEIKTEAGIFQIKNIRNQKVLVESSPNLQTLNGQKFQLVMGVHRNKKLQQEWNEFGEEAFEFGVLELVKKKEEEPNYAAKDALKKLKEQWVEQLQPFGDRGYNE